MRVYLFNSELDSSKTPMLKSSQKMRVQQMLALSDSSPV